MLYIQKLEACTPQSANSVRTTRSTKATFGQTMYLHEVCTVPWITLYSKSACSLFSVHTVLPFFKLTAFPRQEHSNKEMFTCVMHRVLLKYNKLHKGKIRKLFSKWHLQNTSFRKDAICSMEGFLLLFSRTFSFPNKVS